MKTTAALILLALALASPAGAARSFLVGLDDDTLKWANRPGSVGAAYLDLGVGAVRVTLHWEPGQRDLAAADAVPLSRVVRATFGGIRVVADVYGDASAPPRDAAARDAYCGYVRTLVLRYPQINDVVIWNEANSKQFWQHPSGGDYEALLARCWDVLHAARPGVNVIASTAPHAKPAKFWQAVGTALRASGRTLPVVDTVGHNVYPDHDGEPVTATHGSHIDEGDYPRLVDVLGRALGTVPPIWYLEDGFQTDAIAPEQQAAQLDAALRLAYCQARVEAFFNFELVDERDPAGWQSGLITAAYERKPAYDTFRRAIRDLRQGVVRC